MWKSIIKNIFIFLTLAYRNEVKPSLLTLISSKENRVYMQMAAASTRRDLFAEYLTNDIPLLGNETEGKQIFAMKQWVICRYKYFQVVLVWEIWCLSYRLHTNCIRELHYLWDMSYTSSIETASNYTFLFNVRIALTNAFNFPVTICFAPRTNSLKRIIFVFNDDACIFDQLTKCKESRIYRFGPCYVSNNALFST